MSTFGLHKLDWLMVSKRFSWNVKYETIYGWFTSFTVIYTIIPRVRNSKKLEKPFDKEPLVGRGL
jgi:hypothetical protein